jgi:hypothetical protein
MRVEGITALLNLNFKHKLNHFSGNITFAGSVFKRTYSLSPGIVFIPQNFYIYHLILK